MTRQRLMRPGARLGVDVGTVRVGVATCDPDGRLATPLETVRRGAGDLDRIAALAAERAVLEVVVGLPTSLSGRAGPAARAVTAYAEALAGRLRPAGVAVRLVDERFSTVAAARTLRASGVDARRGRSVIDQAAAVTILQGALDAERSSGRPAGRLVAALPAAGRSDTAPDDTGPARAAQTPGDSPAATR